MGWDSLAFQPKNCMMGPDTTSLAPSTVRPGPPEGDSACQHTKGWGACGLVSIVASWPGEHAVPLQPTATRRPSRYSVSCAGHDCTMGWLLFLLCFSFSIISPSLALGRLCEAAWRRGKYAVLMIFSRSHWDLAIPFIRRFWGGIRRYVFGTRRLGSWSGWLRPGTHTGGVPENVGSTAWFVLHPPSLGFVKFLLYQWVEDI